MARALASCVLDSVSWFCPRAPFLAPLLGTGETFFPGKGDTEEELSKFQGHSEFLTLQPGLLGDGGVHLWSCPGSRPSPTPSPALHFLLMKYAWRTDVPAPPLPTLPPRASPRPQLPGGSQIPLPMTAWPGCLILMRGGLASQWKAGGVCVYLHIYIHRAGSAQVCVMYL